MKALEPVSFPEANLMLIKPESMTDEECRSLGVYTDGRECISKWHFDFWKRLSVLFFGTVWLSVLSGSTQPPVWLDPGKNIFKARKERP